MNKFDFKPDRVAEKCRKWDIDIIREKFGNVPKDFLPFWIADMDFKVAKAIENKFVETVKQGVFGYTYCYEEFYNAIINWQNDMHEVKVEKCEITLTYGTVSTLHYVIQAFLEKGDSIILNTPVYDPFYSCAKKQGIDVIFNRLIIIDNRYYINFEQLELQIKKYKPKMMLFCTPHNPSGRIWDKEELNLVAKICYDNNVILIADEVHAEHIHMGKFTSIYNVDSKYFCNIILLTSPNKAFNLGGLKTSYSIIKSSKLQKIFKDKLNQNSITSPNVFGIIGLITAYDECRDWLREVNAYIKGNFDILEEFVNKTENLSIMKMESSYLAWLDISKLNMKGFELTNKLALEQGILVEDGAHFVDNGKNFIRINLGTQRDNVLQLINCLHLLLKN